MEKVLNKLSKLKTEEIEPNILKTTLDSFDFAQVDYLSKTKGIDLENLEEYQRIYLTESPIRVFLTLWPAQHTLPVHQHKNFWGYIAVLKGLLTETSFVYEEEEKKLACHPPKNYRKGEVLFTPLNFVHHLQNPSPSKPLVTAHFYFPPAYSYEGVKLFDIKNKKMAVLNSKAPSVSWNHPKEYYEGIFDDAFAVENLW